MRNHRSIGMLTVLLALLLAVNVGCKRMTNEEQGSSQASAASAGDVELDEDDRFGLEGRPMKGAADGVVTIVEFSDFQCPFCSRVNPTIAQIVEEYPDQVRIFFKQMPLGFHDRAEPAARAALAAHNQGKFWEMHDLMFENQRALTDENFVAWAEELGLDIEQFQADYESDELRELVQADLATAQEIGVRGTPNFYINGVNVRGAQPFANFQSVIDAEIEAMNALIEGGSSLGEALGARLEENMSAAADAQQEQERRPSRPTPDPEDELYVPVGNSPAMGPDNALVTLVVFSEFQCPFCNRIRPTIDQLRERYGDQLRVVFKHNPLDFHDRAEPAARAAIAAQNQGKFWEFHDLMFDNQRALTDENFLAWAEELGLNIEQFQADMQAEATTQQIREDQQLAQRVRAQGTPHSFVNGMRVRGAQPPQAFQQIIDAQIELAQSAIENGAPADSIYEHLQSDANRGQARMIQPEGDDERPQQADAPSEPVEIPIGDNVPSKGPADAPVTIVEYTDFECPFCSRFANNLDEAISGFEGQVRVVVKQFPLAFHQNAQLASEASLAAHAQGKFWEFHDLLWQNQRALTRPDLERYAEQIGLNMDQFRTALDERTYQEQVQAEFREGQGFGVRGTPTWFVNGQVQRGALPPAQIRSIIEQALEEAGE